jgi:hypothetical protein
VDAALISWIALVRAPAFGLALVMVGFLYLPLRDIIARKLFRRDGEIEASFQDILAIALAEGEVERMDRWRGLLDRVFQPLKIVSRSSG